MLVSLPAVLSLIGSALAAPHIPTGDQALAPFIVRSVSSSDDVPPEAPPVASQPTLRPAVHWEHPKSDLRNLQPESTHRLYYSSHGVSDASIQHQFATVDTNLVKEAVILEHSNYIQSVTCQAGTITVSFTELKAYDYAKNAWSSLSEFLLVTALRGCGTRPDERSFWDVHGLVYHDASLTITALTEKEIGSGEAMHDVDMKWGTWNPVERKVGLPTSWGKKKNSLCGDSAYVNSDGLVGVRCHDDKFDENLDNAIKARHGSSTHQKRASFLTKLTKAFTQVATNIARVATIGPSVALAAVGKIAENTIGQIPILDKLTTFSPALDSTITVGIAATNFAADAPWEKSVSLYKAETTAKSGNGKAELEVFCVDCHLTGTLHLAGQATWSLSKLDNGNGGVTVLYADTNALFDAQVAIGVQAQAEYKKTFDKDIIRLTPPPPAGFSVGDLVSVGPYFSLSARAEVGFEAQGQILVGATLTFPSFKTHFDLLDGSKSTGDKVQPSFEKIFNASGEVKAYAGVSLPVAIGIGVSIKPLNKKFDAELVDAPGINTELSYGTDEDCPGINYVVNATNNLFASLLNKEYPIFDYNKTLVEGCYTLGGSATTTTSPTTTDATATTDLTNPTETADAAVTADLTATADLTTVISTPSPTASTLNLLDDVVVKRQNRGTVGDSDGDGLPDPKDDFRYVDTDDVFSAQDENSFNQLATQSEQANNGSTGAYPNGTTFITIADATQAYKLVIDDKLNIAVADFSTDPTNQYFAVKDGVVYGDSYGSFLHYYADVMARYNVSRIRASVDADAPATAKEVFMVPAPSGDNSQTYVYGVVDVDGAAFALLLCNYNGQPSKMFLVKDGSTGNATLTDPSLRDTVTGGDVTSCADVGWVVPQDALTSEWMAAPSSS